VTCRKLRQGQLACLRGLLRYAHRPGRSFTEAPELCTAECRRRGFGLGRFDGRCELVAAKSWRIEIPHCKNSEKSMLYCTWPIWIYSYRLVIIVDSISKPALNIYCSNTQKLMLMFV
jgi:hypothetical protein